MLHTVHNYTGGEVSFYFTWVAMYTRYVHVHVHVAMYTCVSFYFTWVAMYTRALWIPAVLGLALYLADELYFNDALQVSAQPVPNANPPTKTKTKPKPKPKPKP